jgi:hypothetical protein
MKGVGLVVALCPQSWNIMRLVEEAMPLYVSVSVYVESQLVA